MAAFESYQAFNAKIPERDLSVINDLQTLAWSDLLAARSEEARLRVVENYVRDVRERLVTQKG